MFGIEFIPQEPYWKIVYYSVQAEKQGFSSIWITDHFMNRNPYVTMATIAVYTSKINVGVGVTNPYLANPVVTAQAIGSLDEIAPGRIMLGIGAGDKTTLGMLGVKAGKPLTAVKECVEICRGLLSGEKVSYRGKIFDIKSAKFAFKTSGKIKIYVGAQGPKMLRLAARIGDGVLINASHPRDVEDALKHVDEGLREAGRTRDDIDIAIYTSFSIAEDEKEAIKATLPVVAFIVAGAPDFLLEKHDIPLDQAKTLRKLLDKAAWGEAFSKVTPDMIEAFSIAGNPEQCLEKVERLFKLGVNQFVVGSPIGSNIRKSIDLIASRVIPAFSR